MQFQLLTAITLATLAVANPLEERAPQPLCAGLEAEAVCCDADVLSVLDFACVKPYNDPKNKKQFRQGCYDHGKAPHCCAISLAGLGVLCADV